MEDVVMQDVDVGSPFLVNTVETDNQLYPASIALPDGRFVVCWTDYAHTAVGAPNIKMQIFAADGSKIGGEILVSTPVNGYQVGPSIGLLASGGFVVTWTEAGTSFADHNGYSIVGQRFDSAGHAVNSAFQINSTLVGDQVDASLTGLSNGGFVVTWTDFGLSSFRAQIFDAAGARVGGEFSIDNAANALLDDAKVIALGTNRFLATWTQWGGNNTDSEILAQVFDNNGNRVGSTFVVNTTHDYQQIDPSVAVLSDGRFVITWTDFAAQTQAGVYTSVRGQIFSANGQKLGSDFLVNTTATYWQMNAEVTALASGGFAVTWTQLNTTDSYSDHAALRAQIFDSAGQRVGGELLLGDTHSADRHETISGLAYGGFVVSWSDYSGADSSGAGIRAVIIAPGPSIFTDGSDTVDFNTIPVGSIAPAFNARGGDDHVVLPSTDSGITAWQLQGGFHGGTGNDTITAGAAAVTVYGDDGDDTLTGSSGADLLDGGTGDDILYSSGPDDDDAADILVGGIGSDVFLIGNRDKVLDAEAGELIELEGSLNGDRLLVSRGAGGPEGYDIVLSSFDSTGNRIGGAVLHTKLDVVALNIDRYPGGTSIVIGDKSDVPRALTETFGETYDRLVQPHVDELHTSLVKFLDDDLQGKGRDYGIAVLASMGIAQYFKVNPSVVYNTFLEGFEASATESGAGTVALLALAAETSVEFGVRSIIFKVNDLLGNYHTPSEREHALETLVMPSFDTLVNIFNVVDASREVVAGLASTLAGELADALVSVRDFIEGSENKLIVAPETGGIVAGTDGDDVIVGAGESVVFLSSTGSNAYIDASHRGTVDYSAAGSAVHANLASGTGGYGTTSQHGSDESAAMPVAQASPPPSAADSFSGVANLIGSIGADTLTGDMHDNRIEGRGGDDVIDGADGADMIFGEANAYPFTAGQPNPFGNDILHGGDGNDLLAGGRGNDQLFGGAGDDRLVSGDYLNASRNENGVIVGQLADVDGGNDVIDGGDGFDFAFLAYFYRDEGVRLDHSGGAAATTIYSGGQAAGSLTGVESVSLYGGNGDDWFAASYSDAMFGAEGNDVYLAGPGADTFFGGNGIDTISYERATTGVVIDLVAAINPTDTHGSAFDTIRETENVDGSAFADSLAGDGGDNVLRGLDGADLLLGRGGQDTLFGGVGADRLEGGDGNDLLDGGQGIDSYVGGAGNDTFMVDNQAELVFENAGEGTDSVVTTGSYYLYANIENLTLAAGAGSIFGVGNELANTITGNEGGNTLLAGAGNDTVHGGAGVDIIYGEDGSDQLFGDADNDVIVGGAGNDAIDGGTGGDSLYGEDGNDTLTGGTDFVFDQLVGGAGDDVLHGDSGLGDFDYLIGNAGNDSYYVDTYADLVFESAGEGTDTVYASTAAGSGYYLYANIENLVLAGSTFYGVGNELANRMTGSALDNWLLGGAGNDILNGKAGNDVLFGQDGADTFVFEHGTGGDTIADFVAGTDKIDLSAFGFTSFAQVQAAMSETGGSSAIVLGGGDLIVLQNVTNASLHSGDFILSGGSAVQVEQLVRADPDDVPRGSLIHQFDAPWLMVSAGDLGANLSP